MATIDLSPLQMINYDRLASSGAVIPTTCHYFTDQYAKICEKWYAHPTQKYLIMADLGPI
jgi:hypothetical protein